MHGRFLEERTNLAGVPLQAAHGGHHLALEVGFIRHDHAPHGVGLQMLPHELVGIAIRRVRRQEKQPQPEKAQENQPERIQEMLKNIEANPKDLERERARLRAVRRGPPARDW